MAATGAYSIVLLFADQANSLQIAPPLREKGLDVHVVASAAELIQIIAAQKFDLVCLSVNHSSASSLVQVLKIKTHVAVLVFGEDQQPDTARAILKTSADYQVTGTITSYNIWMKIGHLVKEKQRHAENASRMLQNRLRKEDDGNIVVKSSQKPKDTDEGVGSVSVKAAKEKSPKLSVVGVEEKITVKSAIPKKEKKILMGAKRKAPLLQVEGADAVEVIKGGDVEDTGSVAVKEEMAEPVATIEVKNEKAMPKGKLLKMNKAPKASPSQKVDVAAPANSELGAVQTVNAKASSASDAGVASKPFKALKSVGKVKKIDSPLEVLSEEEQIDREIDQLQNLLFDAETFQEPLAEIGKTQLVEENLKTAKDQKVNVMQSSTRVGSVKLGAQTAADTAKTEVRELSPALDNGNVLLEEAVSSYQSEEARLLSIEAARAHRKKIKDKKAQQLESALKIGTKEHLLFKKVFREAVAKAGAKDFVRAENTNSIGTISKVTLIPVDNISERGFIIVANSLNSFASQEEIKNFKNTLANEMNGFADKHEFSLGESYELDTQEVDVSAWAARSSQFFHTFDDPKTGNQVIICFLKRENVFPETCHMEAQRMHRIEIQEVPARLPVSFDAYLFLARNDKMLPYLRRGGSLTAKQIQRLYQRGFKFLYVKDEDVREYYEFYFSFSLNQDFRTEKKFA